MPSPPMIPMRWVTVPSCSCGCFLVSFPGNEKPPTEVDGRVRTPGAGVRYRMTMTVLKVLTRVSGSRYITAERSRTLDAGRPYRSRSVRATIREVPMSRLAKVLIATAVVVVLVVVGGGFAFYKLFVESNPKPPAKITKTATVGGGALDGTYKVAPGDPDSFVGYRVQEQLVGGAIEQTATGR